MMNLTEYLVYRIKKDNINEYDMKSRNKNATIIKGYVDDFFYDYLNQSTTNSVPPLDNITRYSKHLGSYDRTIKDWLMELYTSYGIQLNKSVFNFLKTDSLFLLFNKEEQFIDVSKECHSYLLKKYPYLENDFKNILNLVKFRHKMISNETPIPLFHNDDINNWLEHVQNQHSVNVIAFVSHYINRFSDKYLEHYNYKKTSNLFNLDNLFKEISHISFLKNKKSYLEYLMMYEWLHSIDSDKEYWKVYQANHELTYVV